MEVLDDMLFTISLYAVLVNGDYKEWLRTLRGLGESFVTVFVHSSCGFAEYVSVEGKERFVS